MKLNHSLGGLLAVRMDPVKEVCLLVNTYEVTLPCEGDIFIDQTSLDSFLNLTQNEVKNGRTKSPPGDSKRSWLERITVLGLPLTEIKRKVSEIIRKIDGKWSCTECGKVANTKQNTEHHIESHIRGTEFLCNLCQKKLRSTQSARYHACKV